MPDKGGIHLYEIKSSPSFREDFTKNIKYVSSLIKDVDGWSIIYDGESKGNSLINIRDI